MRIPPITVHPPVDVPMPLADAQPGDHWWLRGPLKRADGGPRLAWPKAWERVKVIIREVGPGYVIEVADVESYEWWTGMDAYILELKPPGRGWKRTDERTWGRMTR